MRFGFVAAMALTVAIWAAPAAAGPLKDSEKGAPAQSQAAPPPATSGGKSSASSDANEDMACFSSSDAAMNAAIARGNATLPRFEQLWNEGRSGANGSRSGSASIKFALTTGDQTEHIWLEVTSVTADAIIGRLENVPVYSTKNRQGEVMTIQKRDVEDWIVRRDNNVWGGYTERLVLAFQNLPNSAELIAQYRD